MLLFGKCDSKGLNNISGNKISMLVEKDIINNIFVYGDARGNFTPEKNNSKINTPIDYSANQIN